MLNKFFASLSWLLKTLTNLHLAVKNGFSFVCQFTVYFKQIINELNIILENLWFHGVNFIFFCFGVW